MVSSLSNVKFKKKHLLCLDSDGTVIDAMNIKHNKCHGPAFIEVFGLEKHREEVQRIWNSVNLYRKTRGINRFLALLEVLKTLDGKILSAGDLRPLENWINRTSELSADSLKNEIERYDAEILEKALKFSNLVNKKILEVNPDEKNPFDGVIACLENVKDKVDIAVVSSSNIDAILKEWETSNLLKYADLVTSLEIGSKSECLEKIIATGVSPERILMVGDSMSDLEVAEDNGTCFYPILIKHEKKSWDELSDRYIDEFIRGSYKKHQNRLIRKFYRNFED